MRYVFSTILSVLLLLFGVDAHAQSKKVKKAFEKSYNYLAKQKFDKVPGELKKCLKKVDSTDYTQLEMAEFYSLSAYSNMQLGNGSKTLAFLNNAVGAYQNLPIDELPDDMARILNGILTTAHASGYYSTVDALVERRAFDPKQYNLAFPITTSNEVLAQSILVRQGFLFDPARTIVQLAEAKLEIEAKLGDKAFYKSITDKDQEEIENNFARMALLQLDILALDGRIDQAYEQAKTFEDEFKRVLGKGSPWEGRLYRKLKEYSKALNLKDEAVDYAKASLKLLEKELSDYNYEVLFEKLDLCKYYFELNKALPGERIGADIQKDSDYYKKYPKSNHTVAKYMVSFEKSKYTTNFKKAKGQANSVINFLTENFETNRYVIREINYLKKYFLSIGDFEAAISAAERFAYARNEYFFADAPARQEGDIDLALLKLKYLYQPAEEKLYQEAQLNQIANTFSTKSSLYLKSVELAFFQALFINDLELAKTRANQWLNALNQLGGTNNQDYLDALYNLGKLHVVSGDIQALQELIAQFIEIEDNTDKLLKDEKNSIYLGYLQGSLSELLGDFAAAEKTFSKAFRQVEKNDRKQKSFVNIEPEVRASVSMFLGNLEDAEEILENALEKKSDRYGADAFPLVSTYLNLSKLRLQQGNVPEAKKMVGFAQDILRGNDKGNNIQLLQALELEANLNIILGDRELAYRTLDGLLQREETVYGRQHFKSAITRIKRAWMSFFIGGDVDEALADVERSLGYIENSLGKSHPDFGFGNWMKSALLLEKKEFQLALNFADSAQNVYQSIDRNHEMLVRIGSLKGDIYYSWDKTEKAEEAYSSTEVKARRIYNSTHPSLADIRFKVASTRIALGNNKGLNELEDAIYAREEFLQKDFPFLTQREKQKFYAGISKELQYFPHVILSLENSDKRLEDLLNHRMKTKGVLLKSKTDFESIILKSGNVSMIAKLEEWRKAQNDYTKRLMGGESSAEDKDELETLLRNAERLENEILQVVSDQKNNDDPSAKNLLKSLEKNEVLVEIIRAIDEKFQPHYYAIIGYDRDLMSVEIPDASNLELSHYRYMQRSLEFETKDQKSFGLFWSKIDSLLPNDIETVYFSPDGIYHLINPEMLKAPGDSLYLVDKFKMIRVSNPRDILNLKEDSKNVLRDRTSLLIGNPKFAATPEASSVDQLLGAAEEVASLNKSMGTKGWTAALLSDEMATEDTLLNSGNMNVLHIATHGFFKDSQSSIDSDLGIRSLSGGNNPLINSGLLLANGGENYRDDAPINGNDEGIFTALEAQNLKLNRCELVVLSACETGQGSVSVGNGVFGLQKSFLDAGAQNILMTLQKVNDEVTQKLMDAFYEAYLNGEKAEDALYKAKRTIKEEYPHPHYWAPFILVK